MSNFKKFLYATIASFLLIFSITSNVYALNVGWDRFIKGGLRTLFLGDKVLIGNTATTTNATLEVVGEIASGYYTATSTTATSTFAGGMNVAGTAGLTVLQNGNVGVGTVVPAGKMQINADASGKGLIIRANATSPGNIFEVYEAGGGLASYMDRYGDFYTNGNGGFGGSDGAAQLIVLNNGVGSRTVLKIRGVGGQTAPLQEWINSVGTILNVVDNLGNVGIGTTSPNWKLSVAGNISADDYVRASYFTATSTPLYSTFPYADITTSLKIPRGTAPTINAQGQLALDTTSNNLIIATSTTGHIVVASATTSLYAFSVASTSPDFASGGILEMPSYFLPQVVTAVWCKVDGGTSQQIFISDGTNDSNTITCTTTGTQYAITSNNSFTAEEQIRTEFVTKSGSPDYLIVRWLGYRTTD